MKTLAFFLILIGFIGCELASLADYGGEYDALNETPCGPSPLCTDAPVYTARPGDASSANAEYRQYVVVLVARYENRTSEPVYLDRCGGDSPTPMYGIELVGRDALVGDDAGEGAAYDRVWACAGHDRPLEVPPGTARTDTLYLSGPNAWLSGGREGVGVLEGSFRLVYDARSCREDIGCELPDARRKSPVFDIRLAR